MRDFLKVYGVVLLFAVPCGGIALFSGPLDRRAPAIAGMPASEFVLGIAAVALLWYALYHHHRSR